MIDRQPTQEQIQKFWEWCGRFQSKDQKDTGWWIYPNGEIIHGLPVIDLNNLFKYAVPKLKFPYIDFDLSFTDGSALVSVQEYSDKASDLGRVEAKAKDPALALFWAINEVTKEK
jgi:hypothetical protein